MTHSTARKLTVSFDEREREIQKRMRDTWQKQQNEFITISGRNLFDDEASSSNNVKANPSTPFKTLREHFLPNSASFQNPIILPAEQTRKIVNSCDILLIQGTCSSLTKDEGWNRIEEYIQYRDNLWDDPSPSMNISSNSEVDIINHDGKWVEAEEGGGSNEVQAFYFYPKPEPVEPLEWKDPKNRLKPSSIEPPKLELKELPEYLKYAFLQENNQLLMVISSSLSATEKTRLLKVLRNHKGAISWSIVDIKGVDSSFCVYKILMPVQVVPKKRGMTVVKNEKNKLIHQRTVTGWRVCIDYLKLNNATRKDHFTLPFIDQMLERLDGHEHYCFLDGFSSSFHHCLKNLKKMLKRCEENKLILNWEKCHLMVKEGIILGHKVFGLGIKYLVLSNTIVFTDDSTLRYLFTKQDAMPRLIKWILLLQELDIKIRDKKGFENLTADHVSRLENPDLGKLTKAEFRDLFPEEQLMTISDKGNEPWYVDYANYLASRVLPFCFTVQEKQKFFNDLRHYF
nr:hypothetical protein [Tanacetum cinerariifolium]